MDNKDTMFYCLYGFMEGVKWSYTNASRQWGRTLKLKLEQTRLDRCKFAFNHDVVDLRNGLPAELLRA